MTLSAAPDYHPRPAPFHEIFSLTLRSMNSSWLWDYLAVKIPLTLKKLKITTNYDLITLATPPPSPQDFLTGPDKHELSLTVRFSHDKNIYTTTINYDFVCFAWLPSPPLPMRFSRWPWERWTLLDGEIISWSKSNQPWKLENYYKLWLFLSYLITLATPPSHEIFSLTLTIMNCPWQWDFLMTKIFPQVP